MRNRILSLAGGMLIALLVSPSVSAQCTHDHKASLDVHETVCYAGTTPMDIYIPPPEAYRSRLKSGEEAGAKFNFIINNSPGSLVPNTLKKAGEIWGSLISSPIPITVEVTFTTNLPSGALGSNIVRNPYRLRNNGYLDTRWYPTSLAEKLVEYNLSSNEPDMEIKINSESPWYFGTDGNTPSNKYDFLTVILHEIAHGLGFDGYLGIDEDTGVGYGTTTPGVFDGFFENDKGEKLSDTAIFPRPSDKLAVQLQTAPVIFSSPVVAKALPDEAPGPNMHIPTTWQRGSSLYHVESRYGLAGVNEGRDGLMTSATAPGAAIHDPGPLATNMLYEIGWVHTYVIHDTLKDRETLEDPFTVTADIYGDKGVMANTQFLFYSFDGFQTMDSVAMTKSDTNHAFSADIPVSSLDITVSYFIRTMDTYGRVYTMPAKAPENKYEFYVGVDAKAPSIFHSPVKFILITNDSIAIDARIWDNLGLDSTLVEYMVNDVPQASINLEYDTLNTYTGAFIFEVGEVAVNDVIKYRVKAVDGSVAKNTSYDPASGYYEFKVEELPPYADSYSNDFESGIDDFLVKGFYHTKPDGWSSYGLHTDHPYPTENKDDSFDDYYAQLKTPIRLHSGLIQLRWDEIVYVEPGEPESVWGDEDMWDYVIVEGSNDGGNTWVAFAPGYDVRKEQTWFQDYTDPLKQDVPNYLSTAVPEESAMRSTYINLFLAPEFEPDEIVLIRFRLSVDPYSHGWGWAIDNLVIEPLLVGTGNLPMVDNAVHVYPNPSKGMVTVEVDFLSEVEELEVTVLDMVGKTMYREKFQDPGQHFSQYFELGDIPDGIYMMRFSDGKNHVTKKIILAR